MFSLVVLAERSEFAAREQADARPPAAVLDSLGPRP
jgi:hypothetical protein